MPTRTTEPTSPLFGAVVGFDYQAYLASRAWAVKREAVRRRCGNVCERCHRAPHQQTHHKTYARIGHERLDDLLGVCTPCHRYLSGKSNVDPLKATTLSALSRERARHVQQERGAVHPTPPSQDIPSVEPPLTLEEYWLRKHR